VSTRYVGLAVLMWAVTYPSRAIPLLSTQRDRLPPWALMYLRLVGPAVLAALAATGSLVQVDGTDRSIEVGVAAVCVVACTAVVAWRRNLLLGLAVAVALAAGARAVGLG
jgi:branched-subunit amino acid transport protein